VHNSNMPKTVQPQPLISVIIPALNEQARLPNTLRAVQTGRNIEVLVVDGGSSDDTCAIAERMDAALLESKPGRAVQMNAGASAARGEILLFLHADTLVPVGYDESIRRSMAEKANAAGAFSFRVDSPRRALRLVETFANFRSRRLQTPFGDQGLFLRAEDFRAVGGYPKIAAMEDFELVRSLRKRGPIATLDSPAVTSSRRWDALGIARTTAVNYTMILGYWLGVSPVRLARLYRNRGN
jgi:rSAM/selenodomain-associated transferase 2